VKVSLLLPSDPHYAQLRDLERRFPGWQVWAVPRGRSGDATWCARPWPLINADSPEELAERIRTAHSQPPDGSPSLASLRSYAARARRLREFEAATGAAWRRMRAKTDARLAAVMADPVQRFYQRHGHPARCAEQVTTPDAAAAENEEPGTA
jgi:hypothetical protein